METNVLRFEHPEYLYGLLVIPLLIVLYVMGVYLNKKAVRRFVGTKLSSTLLPLNSGIRPVLKLILVLLAFTSLIFAAANLQTGSKLEEVKREGIDLFIAIDISNSMMAEDIAPNRLERAKQAINRLVDKLEGDRIGIIVFAGKAFIQLPLTTDYAAARLFLSTISTDLINAQGTAIASAIETAVGAFDENDHNKAIIIISDGEDHEENAVEAATEANKKGIAVYTIGMGLPDGTPIPLYNQYGKRTGFRKDADNNTVVTRLNETMLQQIAAAGQGLYIRANNSSTGLEKIFDEINQMEKSEIDSKVFTDYEDQFQWFVGLAILLILAELLLSASRKKWEKMFKFFD